MDVVKIRLSAVSILGVARVVCPSVLVRRNAQDRARGSTGGVTSDDSERCNSGTKVVLERGVPRKTTCHGAITREGGELGYHGLKSRHRPGAGAPKSA